MGKTRLALPKSFNISINPKWGLVICKFDSRWDMISALSRAAAHYEKGDLNRIIGGFVGINMGWTDFKSWIHSLDTNVIGKRCGATPEEQCFIGHLSMTIEQSHYEPRYIVACVEGDESTLLHELAHAAYYLNQDYRKIVEDAWNQLKQQHLEVIERCMKEWGYHPDNWKDEWQAYTVENPKIWAGDGKKLQLKQVSIAMEPYAQSFRKSVGVLERKF